MKAGSLLALLVVAALSGCAGGETANPNLAAPKLVLGVRSDGEVVAFVHAAFGERLYDWVSLSVDNATVTNRTLAFSLEEPIPSTAFFFSAAAGTSRETYELRGRAQLDPTGERVRISLLDEDGEWGDEQSFGLPFERVMARRSTA